MPHRESKPGWLSVTEVLNLAINKPFLATWRGNIGNDAANKIQRESQDIGVNVHTLIENRFNGVEMGGDLRHVKMVQNLWDKFVTPFECKAIELEVTHEDESLKLQGTLDAILSTTKGDCVVDFKTSNQLDTIGVPLQLAAYAHLCRKAVWQGCAVRLDKVKDKVEIKWYPDLTGYWSVFRKALALARYIKYGETE